MDIPGTPQPLLTPELERRLARAVEAGVIAQHLLDTRTPCPLGTHDELAAVADAGRRARERFLAANLGLVRHVIRQDVGSSSRERDDLFQEGCVGLAEALERFDWSRGTRFSTWAVPYVRGRVAEARRLDRGGIRIPVRRMRAAASAGEQVLSVASIHGVEELELDWWRDAAEGPDDGPDREGLAVAMQELSVEERSVLVHRYGLGGQEAHTQTATAAALGIPVKRVRTTEEAALRYLREACAPRW